MIQFFELDVNVRLTFPLRRIVGGKAFDLGAYTATLHSDGLVGAPLPCEIVAPPSAGIARVLLDEPGLFVPGEHTGQILLQSGPTVLRSREFPIHVLEHPITPVNP